MFNENYLYLQLMWNNYTYALERGKKRNITKKNKF